MTSQSVYFGIQNPTFAPWQRPIQSTDSKAASLGRKSTQVFELHQTAHCRPAPAPASTYRLHVHRSCALNLPFNALHMCIQPGAFNEPVHWLRRRMRIGLTLRLRSLRCIGALCRLAAASPADTIYLNQPTTVSCRPHLLVDRLETTRSRPPTCSHERHCGSKEHHAAAKHTVSERESA